MFGMFESFNVIFIIISIISVGIFVLVFALIFSPKVRSKMMSNQIKATKYMYDEHEEDLKDMATRSANMSKDATTIKARAIRDGLVGNKNYCKHCGTLIDEDSTFCKSCGKKQ